MRVVLAQSEGPRSVMYGESAYVAFLAFRTRILIAILEAGIGVDGGGGGSSPSSYGGGGADEGTQKM